MLARQQKIIKEETEMQRQQMELIKCSFKEKNKELVQRNTIDQTLDSVTSPDNGYFSME